MKTIFHLRKLCLLTLGILLLGSSSLFGQYCDSTVPTLNVDLSASPYYNWVSPPIQREGSCCGSVAPDVCLEFVITLHPSAIAVSFNIASGAVPPGALFYQIDCGPPTPVGSPICLSGPGPHTLTFCKPGNNVNTFSITSYPAPMIGPDLTINAACQGFLYANYYNEPSISWTSIAPGAQGAYDYLLSCNAGCDTTYFTAPTAGPAYIDYLVCGYDIAGCDPNPICDTIRVNLIPPVDVAISTPITAFCEGITTTLAANGSGGSGAYNYLWNTGATTSSIVVGGGTYSVDITDTSGCFVATDNITITEYPLPVVSAGPDQQMCEGGMITLTGSGAVSYVWDSGVTNGVPFTQGVGTLNYQVTGTDANGCINTDVVAVTIFANPTVSAGPDQEVCEGSSVVLSGAGAATYAWNYGVVDGVSFVPPVGTTNYIVTGTNGNGCTAQDTVEVLVNPLPVVDAGTDQTVCEDTPVELFGSGASTYVWDNGVVDNVSFVPAVGTLTYTVTGTDLNGCVATDNVQVTVLANPAVFAGPDQEVCEGEMVTLNGSGASTYTWSGGVVNGVAFQPSVGNHAYVVTGTDVNLCTNMDTVEVTVNIKPIVNAGPDIEVCEFEWITLFAEGSSNLYWSNGISNNVPFQQPVGIQEYVLTDSLNTGCFDRDTVLVEVLDAPEVLSEDVVICEGESAVLEGSGADYYTWTAGVTDSEPFYPTQTMTYTVTGFLMNGCSDTYKATVTVNPTPDVYFTLSNTQLTTSTPGVTFNNHSTGASSYEWDFGDFSSSSSEYEPYHEFPTDEAGYYTVTLTGYTPEGCLAVYTDIVTVLQDYLIFVPNAFTPDGSGVNDIFKPVMSGFDEYSYTMLIFNRWGEVVFETHDMEIGWDGTYAQRPGKVQDGTYTWKIEAKVKDTAERKSFVGHVSLFR